MRPPPPASEASGGEGSGVEGASANSLPEEQADKLPTPDPPPPLRGRRGEGRAVAAAIDFLYDDVAAEQEFAHGKETSAGSSRRNPAGRISRSAQADTVRGRGRAARAAHPDRTHRARGEARYRRHRAAARKILQNRSCVLDEHAGALRSRNRRRRACAADQENRVLRGGVRATLWTAQSQSTIRRRKG